MTTPNRLTSARAFGTFCRCFKPNILRLINYRNKLTSVWVSSADRPSRQSSSIMIRIMHLNDHTLLILLNIGSSLAISSQIFPWLFRNIRCLNATSNRYSFLSRGFSIYCFNILSVSFSPLRICSETYCFDWWFPSKLNKFVISLRYLLVLSKLKILYSWSLRFLMS